MGLRQAPARPRIGALRLYEEYRWLANGWRIRPAPAPSGRGAAFVSLRRRNYRLYSLGMLVSAVGNGAQRVALIWLVLQLSHGSGTAVGVTVGLQWAPSLLLGMWGGFIADRYDNRKIIAVTQASMACSALALGVTVAAGIARPWIVYVLSGVIGLFVAIDNPVRAAFLGEIVDPAEIPSAVSLQSMIGTLANIVGPATAGVLVGVAGTAPVFLANAVTFVAVIVAVIAMRAAEFRPRPRLAEEKHRLRAGFAQLQRNPRLGAVLCLILVLSTLGLNWQTMVALITVSTYHRSAGSFGLLSALFGIGAVVGALLVGRRSDVSLRAIVLAGLACGATQVVGAAVHTYLLFALALIAIGATWTVFNMSAYSYIQLATPSTARGRTLALYFMAATAGTPVAGPVIGWLADHIGARMALFTNGSFGLATVSVVALQLARVHARRSSEHAATRLTASSTSSSVGAE